jgi:hypothetical protein
MLQLLYTFMFFSHLSFPGKPVDQAKVQLQLISQAYEDQANFSMHTDYILYQDAYNGQVIDENHATFQKFSATRYAQQMGDVRSIQYDGISCMVDFTGHKIIVQQLADPSTAVVPTDLSDYLESCERITVEPARIILEYGTQSNSPYTRVSILYDADSHLLRELVLYPKQQVELMGTDNRIQYVPSVLKIRFHELQENTVRDSDVNYTDYVVPSGKAFKQTQAYQSFELMH